MLNIKLTDGSTVHYRGTYTYRLSNESLHVVQGDYERDIPMNAISAANEYLPNQKTYTNAPLVLNGEKRER